MRAPASQPPPLDGAERGLVVTVAGFGLAVGGLGLASSFRSVSDAAKRWGFADPWMLPVAVDLAIPVFTAANLLLVRLHMPLAWVRWVPWGLTAVTCWLNVAAGSSASARIAHGSMPLLWVVLAEVAAHVYAVRIGAATGHRMEKIRRTRWLLAFPSTFALWRRMTLWEITGYREALELEKRRQLARAELRERHGRRWRSRTPHRERVLLRLAEVAPRDAVPGGPFDEEYADDGAQQAPAETPERPLQGPRARRPRLSFDEHLAEARRVTAGWDDAGLKAERIRQAVGCGQQRSRLLRDVLRRERTGADEAAAPATT